MTNVDMLTDHSLVPVAGLYSHAAMVSSPGRLIAVAGQLASDGGGNVVGEGDFAAQFAQVFENLGKVLGAAGSGWSNVLKFTTYVTRPEDLAPFYEERARLYTTLYPTGAYPPNTLLVVARLVRPQFLIEVEALAVGDDA
jgi:enamine deaminase RidA (YjgF/YER057c/UK114 family)